MSDDQDRRRPGRGRPQRGKHVRRGGPPAYGVRLVEPPQGYALVPPRAARERQADLEEVLAMIAADEVEIAVDELRWLLDGCHALIEAHQLLGEIALDAGDLSLAQGHLGRAYETGLKAVEKLPAEATLPASQPANRPFFGAGRALASCLRRMDQTELAQKVVDRLLKLDPADPLAIRNVLREELPPES